MSARSGMISDLNSLVNEAKSAATGGSGNGGERGGGSNGNNSYPPPPPSPASIASSRRRHTNNNNSVADDASLSSFTRSIARVARAAEGKDSSASVGASVGGSRRGRGVAPPPPPRSGNPHPHSNPANINSRAPSQGSVGSNSRRSRSSSRSGRSSNRSGQSNATDRLMNLVSELSQPKPPAMASAGYLPNQYNQQQRPSPPPRRSSSSGTSRASSLAATSTVNGSLEPMGYVMPSNSPGGAGGYPASIMGGSNTHISGGTSASTYSGSMMGGTSAGQSTMPTEYNGGGNFNNHHAAAAAAAAAGVGGGSGGGSSGGSNASPYDSFASHSHRSRNGSGQPNSTRGPNSGSGSAPGGSNSNNDSRRMIANYNGNDPSVNSSPGSSFASQPLHSSNGGNTDEYMMNMKNGMNDSYMSNNNNNNGNNSNSQYSQSQQGTAQSQYSQSQYESQYSSSQPYNNQMIPNGNVNANAGDMSFASSMGSRSLANSQALIPKARFSWAGESLGTQSTVMTHRSLNSSASVPTPHHEREGNKVMEGRLWASFAWIITFPIPNKCIMRPTKDAKQAWREKVALFIMMVSCSVFFVGVFGFVPLLLCKEDTVFSMQDIWTQSGENWVVVHGRIYDVKDLIYRHPGGVKGIVDYLGKDGSKVFPRAPPVTLPQKCLDMAKVQAYSMDIYTPDNNFTNPTCASFSDLDILLGVTCHTFAAGSNGTQKFLGDYERGVLSHTTVGLNEQGIQWLALYDRVYDVTNYIKAINENREPTMDEEESNLDNNPSAYLTPTLNKVIMNSLGGDATDLYEALFGSSEYIACLEEMFYHGLLDDEFDSFCYTLNIMMYVMLVFVATLMVIQFIASMVYICPRHRTYSEEDVMSPVMIMVPCYNEGDNELRKTIKSVLNTTYPDENKVLFMVADGVVTGDGEDMSTPEHLANILGFDIDEFEDDTFEYDCIGVTHTKNRARVYHGILQKGHKFLKYITVVKCGLPEEATTSPKPGNRGKRDSQLVIMGYYNRIHYGRELTELDSAVQRAMVDLNLQADMVRFLMAIDADTRVDTMSITHMVYGMDKKEKVLALCGETKVDNKASSWVTMIQVFEYYNSHHLKKAFEAAFGCVTCLPGCFTMYRIIADDGTPLLPGDGVLYEYSRNDVETLHEKNLYHLGEDRMLTTLLLKYYPDRSLTFIPEATCWTIVPHTFRILLSQRRRWINSTVHNMFELLRVNTMCGVCCVSMKVVVFIDLIATMILPASYVYAMYLLFLVFFEDLPVSTVLLILYGIIMGVQIVVFLLRSRWEYLWWFLIYFIIGLPVFYLILPTYAFWNMDDFSWGKTRGVGGNAALNTAEVAEEEDDDDEYKESDNLITDGANAPRAVQEDMRSTTSSSSSSSGQDSRNDDDDDDGSDYKSGDDDRSDYESGDNDGSDYESGSEYSDSQAESEYFSQASNMQDSKRGKGGSTK